MKEIDKCEMTHITARMLEGSALLPDGTKIEESNWNANYFFVATQGKRYKITVEELLDENCD